MVDVERDRFYDGVIVKRSVEPTGQPPGVDPLQCRYDAVAVNTKDSVRLTGHLPSRRISTGVRVIPANVGDPCRICIIDRTTFLHAFTEGIPFEEACP